MKKYHLIPIISAVLTLASASACAAFPNQAVSTPSLSASSTPAVTISASPAAHHTLTPTCTNSPTQSPTATLSPTPSLPPEALEISEVMATNKTYPLNGTLCDWIELHNAGDTDINLSNFYLSDKEGKPFKSQLPDVVLKPGEYMAFPCENEISVAGTTEKVTIAGALSFKLSGDGETICLTRSDGLRIDSITYENLESDFSFTKEGVCSFPSPGFENTEEGHDLALAQIRALALSSDKSGLLINEILSSNNGFNKYTGQNNIADYYDIVELYNSSTSPILLSDYYLSDSAKHLVDYRLPNVTLQPGQYMLIYCMGRAAGNYEDPTALFTLPESPIELSYFGETLYLTNKSGYIEDIVTFPEMYNGISYGRDPEQLSQFVIQKKPSLGKKNQSGESSISSLPLVSLPGGAYKDSVTVEFTSGGKIYYTTDCSVPTTASKLWDGKPLVFDKTTTLRAICYEGNKVKSVEAVYTYFINDLDVTLDVVSITLPSADWTTLQATQSKAPNFAIHITLFKNNRTDNSLVLNEEFSVGAALELSGASSMYSDKQSYQIKFKSKYGPSKLIDKLFDNSDVCEFNSILLRGGSQSNASSRCLVRDEIVSSLLYSYYGKELILSANYRPVNLYVNNEYRGIYYIREHLDADMIASHNGVDSEDVVFSKNMSSFSSATTDADMAEIAAIKALLDSGDFSDPAVLEEFCRYIDYESLLVFWATELWSNDHDCHIRVYKVKDGKWKFLLQDHDLSWIGTNDNTYSNKFFRSYTVKYQNGKYVYYENGSKVTPRLYQQMINQLVKSDKFRGDLFAKIAELTTTAYSNEYASAYARNLLNTITHDMVYNCNVWGGKRLYPKSETSMTRCFTYNVFAENGNVLVNRIKRQRELTIESLKKYLNMTDEEEKLYFGKSE